jgi:hypothetical protein
MSIGQGSFIVLEAICIDARTAALVYDDEVYYSGLWDDLKDAVHAYAWPSLQDIPGELLLIPLQKKKFLHENGMDAKKLDFFALLLRDVNLDDVHSQRPSTFRRVGSGIISLKHEENSHVFTEAVYDKIRWEAHITLI